MHTFGTRSHTWELSLNIEACTRVRAHLKLDLLKPEQADAQGHVPVLQLYSDPLLLIRCVALCLAGQLKENFATQLAEGLKDEITGEPLSLLDLFALDMGDGHFEALREAFFAELRDFFRRLGLPEKGAVLLKQLEIIDRSAATMTAKVAQLNLDQTLRGLEQLDLQAEIEKSIPGITSTPCPPSPGASQQA